jgi:hypothetical protein
MRATLAIEGERVNVFGLDIIEIVYDKICQKKEETNSQPGFKIGKPAR